ncbi:UNVERIFIED_CONTAM: hypothetical protein Slati_1178700, partial [Sesamum latifolium]
AWRIAMNPENVLHYVISNKYFPGSTFVEARLGANPSYTWRSIWASRDILFAGIRWQVGDGRSIPILGQPWLPRPTTFQLIARPTSMSEDSKMASLILPSNEWNVSLIKAEFHPMDVDCILSSKLHEQRTRDQLIWHYESKGKFIVKSAYRLAIELHDDRVCSQLDRSWNFIGNPRCF